VSGCFRALCLLRARARNEVARFWFEPVGSVRSAALRTRRTRFRPTLRGWRVAPAPNHDNFNPPSLKIRPLNLFKAPKPLTGVRPSRSPFPIGCRTSNRSSSNFQLTIAPNRRWATPCRPLQHAQRNWQHGGPSGTLVNSYSSYRNPSRQTYMTTFTTRAVPAATRRYQRCTSWCHKLPSGIWARHADQTSGEAETQRRRRSYTPGQSSVMTVIVVAHDLKLLSAGNQVEPTCCRCEWTIELRAAGRCLDRTLKIKEEEDEQQCY
jgi:hypothetical protein